MGKRDARYQLSKDFEIDEAFFETVDFEYIKRKNDEPLKAGRGSQRQAKVLSPRQVSPHPFPQAKKPQQCTLFDTNSN